MKEKVGDAMSKSDSDLNGCTITDIDGQQYFIYGKNHIKIVEHFPDKGPTLADTLMQLSQQKIRENAYI